MEKYLLAHISAAVVDPARATQPDNIREYRWWTDTDLRLYPVALADLVARVRDGRIPQHPVVLD